MPVTVLCCQKPERPTREAITLQSLWRVTTRGLKLEDRNL